MLVDGDFVGEWLLEQTQIAIGVAEPTRRIGVMNAIGASDRRILPIIVGGAALFGVASALVVAALSLPLTVLVESLLGRVGLIGAAPLAVSVRALVVCPAAAVAGSVIASWWPARRAAHLSVRAALAEV